MEKRMKKQTLKKRKNKFEEGEAVASKQELEEVIRKRKGEIIAKNNDFGITLIALVITVIVLLILAGISISMLSGNNSILSRAGQAKTKTEYGKAQEALSLAYAEAVGDRYLNNSTTALEREVVQKLQNAGYTIETEASGSAQIELSSTSVTLEEGGNTEEVTATIKADTKYMLVDGLYYPLTITDSTATLGTERQSELTGSSISLSDLTLNTTGSITAELNSTTGVITITSTIESLSTDENDDKVELVHKDNGTNYGTINVVVKKAEHIADKSYVDYNVSYTDVYTGTEYRSDTGWRLLTDLSSAEETGTYEGDIEIISTGIPAKLYYHANYITDFENTNPLILGKWAGDSTQRATYATTYYNSRSSNYYNDPNIYAVSGLMYNFENIVFSVTGTKDSLTYGTYTENSTTKDGVLKEKYNYGGYISISNGESVVTASASTTGTSLFRVSSLVSGSVSGIRSVSLADLTGSTGSGTSYIDKRTGLFKLLEYVPDKHSLDCHYWLASPKQGYTQNLRVLYYNGTVKDSGYYGIYGLRPVISISNVKLQLKGNVWKIVK